MSEVTMAVAGPLLEQMLCLGERRITGVTYGEHGPDTWVIFLIEAPDAPPGATKMDPTLSQADDGTVTMLDPGWR